MINYNSNIITDITHLTSLDQIGRGANNLWENTVSPGWAL